jgi:hypothetical protein
MRKLVSAAAVTTLGFMAWQRLRPDQRQQVQSVINEGRRKLANFIAPQEDLGDLTNCVDPAILEILTNELQDQEDVQTEPS